MAESHIVSGLVAKRSEMAGLIDHHQKQITQLAADLGHLDATLKLFAPEMDLRTLRPKEHRERNAWFRPGEVPRFILDTLRQSAIPLSCQAMAVHAVATKGLTNTPETVSSVCKSLHSGVKTLANAGTLREGPKDITGRTWQIA
jgi:hypothetical protein